MAEKEQFGISEQLDCSDCVNHGGDWDCDHVHCRKGTDTISRRAALDALDKRFDSIPMEQTTEILLLRKDLRDLQSVQPERLTDDDFETIRIHLNAQKEKLCNQRRWEEAEEYQRIIDRFMAFASAEPERTTNLQQSCNRHHKQTGGN